MYLVVTISGQCMYHADVESSEGCIGKAPTACQRGNTVKDRSTGNDGKMHVCRDLHRLLFSSLMSVKSQRR